ncbi:exopolyphosphatase [bacterium]|nr:exopolyphosphatase [bacterium]
MNEIYTLYTRSNFDGLVCAALLKEIGLIDEVKFVHPKDFQDGKIEIKENSITACLAYRDGVYMAFDHHSSESVRIAEEKENFIFEPSAPSCARIIYEYFGGENKFDSDWEDVLDAVDIADCTTYNEKDILEPEKWVLLNYIMDPRTGFGYHKIFKISNLALMHKLVGLLGPQTIEKILNDPDVKERVNIYFEEQKDFRLQLKRCTRIENNIAILDLRDELVMHVGNRFMLYSLFPECNVSITVFSGLNKQNTVIAIGKSIINKPCHIDIGKLLYEKFQGGGHSHAGTMQVDNDKADEIIEILISELKTKEEER